MSALDGVVAVLFLLSCSSASAMRAASTNPYAAASPGDFLKGRYDNRDTESRGIGGYIEYRLNKAILPANFSFMGSVDENQTVDLSFMLDELVVESHFDGDYNTYGPNLDTKWHFTLGKECSMAALSCPRSYFRINDIAPCDFHYLDVGDGVRHCGRTSIYKYFFEDFTLNFKTDESGSTNKDHGFRCFVECIDYADRRAYMAGDAHLGTCSNQAPPPLYGVVPFYSHAQAGRTVYPKPARMEQPVNLTISRGPYCFKTTTYCPFVNLRHVDPPTEEFPDGCVHFLRAKGSYPNDIPVGRDLEAAEEEEENRAYADVIDVCQSSDGLRFYDDSQSTRLEFHAETRRPLRYHRGFQCYTNCSVYSGPTCHMNQVVAFDKFTLERIEGAAVYDVPPAYANYSQGNTSDAGILRHFTPASNGYLWIEHEDYITRVVEYSFSHGYDRGSSGSDIVVPETVLADMCFAIKLQFRIIDSCGRPYYHAMVASNAFRYDFDRYALHINDQMTVPMLDNRDGFSQYIEYYESNYYGEVSAKAWPSIYHETNGTYIDMFILDYHYYDEYGFPNSTYCDSSRMGGLQEEAEERAGIEHYKVSQATIWVPPGEYYWTQDEGSPFVHLPPRSNCKSQAFHFNYDEIYSTTTTEATPGR